jgi:hypothetical protein
LAKSTKLPRDIDIKDGSYRARITRNGCKSVRMFDSLSEAKRWLERQRVEMDADSYQEQRIAAEQAKAVSLEQLLEDYRINVTPTKALRV